MAQANPATETLTREITRVFDAPRHLVFQAWTQKEHMDQWSAPRGYSIAFSEGELRVGGRWRCCMRASDGTELWLGGVYRDIVEDELLVFTHVWEEDGAPGHETLVTVRFGDIGKKTKVEFRQEFFDSRASRDGHAEGWTECFDLLDALLIRIQS